MIRRFNPLYALLPLSVFLGACGTSSDESVTPVTDPDAGTGFVATFKPDAALMPFPTDAWRSGSTDGTLNIHEFESDPLILHVQQLNMLDGFGLNSAIYADFSDPIEEDTLVLGATVFVFKVAVGGTATVPTPVNDKFEIGTAGFQGGRSVLELNPVEPLDPLTTYAVLVTAGVHSTDGTAASADTAFQAMVDAYPADDTGAGATVEAIYDGMVHSLLDLAEGATIGADNIVEAWTFTTQSIGASLAVIEAGATARTNAIVPLGMTTADLNAALSGLADVYVGAIEVPYYTDPANALDGYWRADADAPNCAGAVAAEVIGVASDSTTVYCPAPETQAMISVPMLITMPNATAYAANPACGGVPNGVVIFQHGITQDRTNALAVADALAQNCQAVVAIDLPLHGITDVTNGLYASVDNPAFAALESIAPGITDSLTEQTYDIDADGDGEIDDSGAYFINLQSPLTARDALRQAAANLIELTATLPTMLPNAAVADMTAYFNGLPVRFVGHSLGGITGTIYLGVDATADAAVLAMPGGDIGDLILGSESIYPEVEAGLAENGLTPGMRFFDEFFRNAQTLVEGGDPINYAAAAAAQHNILMQEVVGGGASLPDQVVPNSATTKLADAMGLPRITTTTVDPGGVDGLVQFIAGGHGSILDPTDDLDTTVEMQTEMSVYIGGNAAVPLPAGGAAIVISDPSVVKQ